MGERARTVGGEGWKGQSWLFLGGCLKLESRVREGCI